MPLKSSLTFFIHVSSLLIQYAEAQYPLYDMPALQAMQSQVITYPMQLQPSQNYEGLPHEKSKSKRHIHYKKTYQSKRRNMHSSASSSSQESRELRSHKESESVESKSSEDCYCNTCEQCLLSPPPKCCQPSFCQDCVMNQLPINQEMVFNYIPYQYPFLLNIQSNDQNQTFDNTSEKVFIEGTEKVLKELKVTTEPEAETEPTPEIKTTAEMNTIHENKTKLLDKNQSKLKPDVTGTENTKTEYMENRRSSRNHDHKDITNRNNNKRFLLKTPHDEKNTNALQLLIEGEKAQGKDLNEIMIKVPGGNAKYVLTSLRQVKDDLVPQYGIVPIPESMASDLMLQLRDTKLLDSEQDEEIMNRRRVLSLSDAKDKQSKVDLPTDLINKIYRYT